MDGKRGDKIGRMNGDAQSTAENEKREELERDRPIETKKRKKKQP